MNESDEFCRSGFSYHGSFAGPDTTLCPGCTVTDDRAAIDGKGGTATAYTFDSVGGRVSYHAITTGHSFQSGSVAGAYIRFPLSESGGYVNPSITVTTYQDGNEQDSFSYAGPTYGNLENAGTDYFYGGETTSSFDEVLVEISLSGSLQSEDVLLYELCGDY